jgi:hypothetical protein
MRDCHCTGSHLRVLRKSKLVWCTKPRPLRSWNKKQSKYFRNLIEKYAYKTRCPRKCAHILNTFVEKINSTSRVQFSPHETATLKVFCSIFLHLTELWLEIFVRIMSIWHTNALEEFPPNFGWYVAQNGRRVSCVKLWQFHCHVVKPVLFWLCLFSE